METELSMTIVTTEVLFYFCPQVGKPRSHGPALLASLHHNYLLSHSLPSVSLSIFLFIMSTSRYPLGTNTQPRYYPSADSNASSTANLLPPSQPEMPRRQFSNNQFPQAGSLQPSSAKLKALRGSASSNSLVSLCLITKILLSPNSIN
jgi:hypothetical protein